MYQDKIRPVHKAQGPFAPSSRSLTRDFVFISQSTATAYASELCIEALRSANHLIGHKAYTWTHIVASSEANWAPVCQPNQMLVLVGGIHDPWIPNACQILKIRSCMRNAARVCIVGSAIFIPLAIRGLNAREISVHPNFALGVRESGCMSEFSTKLTSHSAALSSAHSPVAAIQMMVELVEAREGAYTGNALRNYLGLEASDTTSGSGVLWRYKRLAQGNQIVSEALDVMDNHIEDTLSIRQIADLVDVSTRQLERSFGTHLECSPLSVYRSLRLVRANKLLIQTALPVSEISVACGFSNASLFGKWYKIRFGNSPGDARKSAFFGTMAA